MKKYRVNVNGTVYEVELEEITGAAMSGSTSRIPSIFRSMDFPYGWRRLRRIHGK